MDPLCNWGWKFYFLKAYCYGNKTFLDNAIDSGNHHTNFEICLITADFIEILQISILGFVLQLAHFYQPQYKPIEKLDLFTYIKSAIHHTNLKLGMMIIWINSIVQKRFVAITRKTNQCSASIMQRVYSIGICVWQWDLWNCIYEVKPGAIHKRSKALHMQFGMLLITLIVYWMNKSAYCMCNNNPHAVCMILIAWN